MPFTVEELKEMLLRQSAFWRLPQICEQTIRIEGSVVHVMPSIVERSEGIGGRIALTVVPAMYAPFLKVECVDRSLQITFFKWQPRLRRKWIVLDPTALQAEALVAYGILRYHGRKQVWKAHEQTLRWLGLRMSSRSSIPRRQGPLRSASVQAPRTNIL